VPANVESMVSVREVPWHGLGEIVQDCLTAKDALVKAGLDWEVELFPVFTKVTRDDGTSKEVEVESLFAVVRDKDDTVLSTCGSKYRPVQNWKSFQFFDDLVGSGDAKYETAGSLDGGRRVWMTAKVPREILIAGQDAVDLYLLLATSHDTSLAFTCAVTPVRTVCQNTLNLALSSAQQSWRIKHTEAADAKINEAREALGLTFKYADEFEAQMNRLVEASFTKAEFEKLVKVIAPEKKPDERRSFSDEQYALIGCYESSPTLEGIRDTKWGALNAVREYDDWYRTFKASRVKTESEQRTEAVWFGRNVDRANATLKYLTAEQN